MHDDPLDPIPAAPRRSALLRMTSTCPPCAFLRGILAGIAIAAGVLWLM